jgi:DNA-binding NtrC family response regulator
MACLYAYDWPGNVRELENVVERLVVMSRGRVDRSDLPARMLVMPASSSTSLPMGDIDLPKFIDEVERDLIQKAMQRAGGNKALAARSLGVTREGLRYKLQKLGIEYA